MTNTVNHVAKPKWELEEDYSEWWDWWIKVQVNHMKKYYDTIIRHCVEEHRNPIYFVRYEDLVAHKKETLMGLFSFLLETKDLDGSNAERRIDAVVGQGESTGTGTNKLSSAQCRPVMGHGGMANCQTYKHSFVQCVRGFAIQLCSDGPE